MIRAGDSVRGDPSDPEWLESLVAVESRALDSPLPIPSTITSEIRRVAIFSEAFLPKVDGVTRTALLTLQHLRRTGREVLIVAPAPAPSEVANVPVVRVPSLWLPDYPDTRVTLPSLIPWHALHHFQPDLIHLFSPFCLGSMGMLAGGALRIPVVANYMTDLPAYTQSYGFGAFQKTFIGALRWLHNGCTLTLTPTSWTQHELEGWGFRRLRVWGRGVDTIRFSPTRRTAQWRERLLAGRDPSSLIALYVGRMAKEKSLDDLREIAALPGVALTLVGEGSHRPQAEAFLNQEGRRAYFMGILLGDDLAQAYAAADVFVFPGARETFGQVVLEAMASGLPVVVSNRGGPAALVDDHHNGFICPVGDAAFYGARVKALRDDPVRRMEMGAQAHQYACARLWPAVMGELERHYADAAALYARLRHL